MLAFCGRAGIAAHAGSTSLDLDLTCCGAPPPVRRKDRNMTQEMAGSATVEVASAPVETTDEDRDQLASQVVDRFSLWSGAAGLIPIPLVDVAAVGGVQLIMLRRLSEIYDVPFSDNRGKSIIASLA